jgi:sugar/nucleoside kinase (ribokinase family)
LLDFVAVGHVTLDRLASGMRAGGSAYYAALTAHRLGLRAGVLTSFGLDFPADALPDGIAVTRVRSGLTTSFELTQSAQGRTLTLLARAADLEADALPPEWSRVPLIMLCPVANEVDPAFASGFPESSLCVAPQGWLRRRDAGGVISPQPWEDAAWVLPHAQTLVLSTEDVAAVHADEVLEWFQQVPVGALTDGWRGATLFVNGERYHVEADRVSEVDPTGAGDVFAATLLVEYHAGASPWDAAGAAACAAAASVEAPGAAGIPDREALAARLQAYRRRQGS